MQKKGILLLFLLVFSLTFTCAFDFTEKTKFDFPTNELNDLDDVTIKTPVNSQVLLYNDSSKLWFNSYLNDSAHHVNASDYWLTGDRGPLRNVADILHNWLDPTSLLWSNAGHIMDTFLDMAANDIINVGELHMVGDIFLNNNSINDLEGIQFNIEPNISAHSEGFCHWDDDAKTFVCDMAEEGVKWQGGQGIYIVGKNTDIGECKVVYLAGSQGNFPFFELASASTEPSSSKTVGITTNNCSGSVFCYVTIKGNVDGCDTSGFGDNDTLWLSDTPGEFQANIPPPSPSHATFIGNVKIVGNEGAIVVSIQNGFEVDELHDVNSSSRENKTNQSVLIWDNESLVYQVRPLSFEDIPDDTIENLVVGSLNVTGNIVGQDRLFIGINPNETSLVINPGDAVVGGNFFIAAGAIVAFPNKYGVSAVFFNNGADDPNKSSFLLNFSGELNTSEQLFCDNLNDPFNESNKRDAVSTLFSNEFGTDQIFLPIDRFINSSCVQVSTRIFGNDNVPGLSSVSYVLSPQPVFGITDNDLVINGIRMFYETNESLDTFGSYTRQNTLQDKPGGNLFADAFTNTDGELEYVFGTQTGLNNSGNFFRNSLGVWSTRFYDMDQKQNLSFLHNMPQRFEDINITSLLAYNSNLTGASLAVEYSIESQKLILHDDIGNGQLLGEGDFSWVAREGTDMEFLNGNGVLISKDIIKEFGFSAGDNITSLTADFDSGVLLPFVQTTGGGISDWSLTASVLCHDQECASASGGSGSPLRSMQANFSSLDQDNLNLSWWMTASQASPDVFSVDVNNNVGSGDVNVFTSSSIFIDEFQSVILPASMNNKSIVTVIFNFQGNNPITDVVYVDEVLVVGNATTTTLANVTVEDAQIKLGDETCGILLSAEDGFQDLNISCDNINLIGNVTAVSVTEVDINVTNNVTIGDTIFVDNIRELTTNIGITLWDNVIIDNNITAGGYFIGDGSFLTGIVSGLWTNISGVATYDGTVRVGNSTDYIELEVENDGNSVITATNDFWFTAGRNILFTTGAGLGVSFRPGGGGTTTLMRSTRTTISDDIMLQRGTNSDYWDEYSSSDREFQFWTTNGTGDGTNVKLMYIEDGTSDFIFDTNVNITQNLTIGGCTIWNNGTHVIEDC